MDPSYENLEEYQAHTEYLKSAIPDYDFSRRQAE